MPLTIPPFSQFQGVLIPLRGLWGTAPAEGDRFLNAEIDWITSTGGLGAQQFSVGGNSPVSLSQIAALYVDNSRCGSDVSFIFPDSAFELVCPAHNQVLAPVLSNALMFYAVAANANAGDVTVLQILNSLPPPIPIAPSVTQNHANVINIPLGVGSTQIVPTGVNGTLNTISLTIDAGASSTTGHMVLNLVDGAGHVLWTGNFGVIANGEQTFVVTQSNMNVRFTNGISAVVPSSSNIGGLGVANLYYSTP